MKKYLSLLAILAVAAVLFAVVRLDSETAPASDEVRLQDVPEYALGGMRFYAAPQPVKASRDTAILSAEAA
jgi:hypothetical protein